MTIPFTGFLVIAMFMFIGPALIVLNQHILKAMDFPYPMFLSGLGVLASGIFARVLVLLRFVKIQRADAIEGWLWYSRVLPVGMASAATLAFGNMVYIYLDLGFIQMLKSFTPVVILFIGYMANLEKTTAPVVISVLIICIGTAATCTFNPQVNILGLLIMFLSEFTEGLKLVMTQYFLQQLKFGVVEGQYVLAPACAFWLFLASAIFEMPQFVDRGSVQVIIDHPVVFLAAATMGIGVNFIGYYVIQYTSSLTMKILNTARSIGLVILGVVWYKEVITGNQSVGYGIALVGFAGYNMAKMGYFESNSSFMIEMRRLMPAFFTPHSNSDKDDQEGVSLLEKP